MSTLKDITENYEKLHRLQMIDMILGQMHSYVHDVVCTIEDEFDYNEDFDDYVTEGLFKNVKEDLAVLGKYLKVNSYAELIKELGSTKNWFDWYWEVKNERLSR